MALQSGPDLWSRQQWLVTGLGQAPQIRRRSRCRVVRGCHVRFRLMPAGNGVGGASQILRQILLPIAAEFDVNRLTRQATEVP